MICRDAYVRCDSPICSIKDGLELRHTVFVSKVEFPQYFLAGGVARNGNPLLCEDCKTWFEHRVELQLDPGVEL